LVAAPKVLVDKYSKLIDMAGLNLVAVETELISIVRSLAPKDQVVLIADIGARSTDIAVSKGGVLTFSRSIPTAGEAFTRAIAQSLGIEEAQAEEYKRTYGMNPGQLEGKIKGSLDPIFKMVAEEMKKATRFYSSEEKGEAPNSAILTGGTAGLPEIASSLTKLLGLEVIVGNPFSQVEVAPDAVKSLAGYAPFYSIAVGLALREV
jgi:type IV pilus assembly protein PilM